MFKKLGKKLGKDSRQIERELNATSQSMKLSKGIFALGLGVSLFEPASILTVLATTAKFTGGLFISSLGIDGAYSAFLKKTEVDFQNKAGQTMSGTMLQQARLKRAESYMEKHAIKNKFNRRVHLSRAEREHLSMLFNEVKDLSESVRVKSVGAYKQSSKHYEFVIPFNGRDELVSRLIQDKQAKPKQVVL